MCDRLVAAVQASSLKPTTLNRVAGRSGSRPLAAVARGSDFSSKDARHVRHRRLRRPAPGAGDAARRAGEARVPRLRLRRASRCMADGRDRRRSAPSATSPTCGRPSTARATSTARSPSPTRPAHDRHRPHPLGDPRPRHRGERPPALRHGGPRPHRRQRDRRELHGAQAASSGRAAPSSPRRPTPRSSPTSSRTTHDGDLVEAVRARLRRARGPLRVRRDGRRRARPARRRAQGVPADRRPRRRRAVRRLGDPRLPGPDAPRPVHRERRDRRSSRPDGVDVPRRRRRADRARGRRRSTGTRRPPRRAATRRSCSRRSTSRPTRWPRRSSTAPSARDGVDLDEMGAIDDELLRSVSRIVVVACGTSYHAGLIGRYAIEEWARVPVEMDIASEYRYRNPVVGPGDLVDRHHPVGRDGRHAGRDAPGPRARRQGPRITNVMGSQATRDADGVLFTRAGLEIGVAATKTFVCQVAAMYLLGLRLAELRGTLERRAPHASWSPSSSACRTASTSCSRRVDERSSAIAARALRSASSSSTSAATSGCRSRSRARSS